MPGKKNSNVKRSTTSANREETSGMEGQKSRTGGYGNDTGFVNTPRSNQDIDEGPLDDSGETSRGGMSGAPRNTGSNPSSR